MDNSTKDLINSLEAVQVAMEKAIAKLTDHNINYHAEEMAGAKNLIGSWIIGIWEESRNGD